MYYYYSKKRDDSYKAQLKLICYHVKRARQEMQKIKDEWLIDKKILSSLECSLLERIREEEKKEIQAECEKTQMEDNHDSLSL